MYLICMGDRNYFDYNLMMADRPKKRRMNVARKEFKQQEKVRI